MAKYKRVDASNGRTMWYVNGDLTSGQKIPEEVLRHLQSPGEVEIEEGGQPSPSDQVPARIGATEMGEQPKNMERICLVCEEPGTHSKYVQGITVYLCDEHYASMTTGKIVQEARSKGLLN